MRGKATRGASVAFGDFGLKALEPGWITQRQIEAARVTLTGMMKREGRIWIRIFPDKPVTKKPAETRMGKGKGAPEYWVAVVKPGPRDVRGGRDRQKRWRSKPCGLPRTSFRSRRRSASGPTTKALSARPSWP